jgi:hypothetical protein
MSFGWGYGPFGHEPFGEWPWSKYVLFDLLPELHKGQDADPNQGNGQLEAWTKGLRPSFDRFKRRIADFGDLRDPLRVRSAFDDVTTLRLGPQILLQGQIEQRGLEGQVLGTGNFFSKRGRFRDRDIGKELTLKNSRVSANNRTVVISQVIGLQEIVTLPSLVFDAGDNLLRWELRAAVDRPANEIAVEVQAGDVSEIAPGWVLTDGLGFFKVLARRQFQDPNDERKVLTEQEGKNGSIDTFGRFTSPTLRVDQFDVGKVLTISGSTTPETNAPYVVEAVVDDGSGTLILELDPVPDPDVGPLVWAIRPRPELVLQASGTPRGVVEQSGFDGELDPDGTLATDIFRASSGAFSAGDVGKTVFLRGSDGQVNDGPTRVLGVLSPRRLQLDATFTVPETNTGSLFWELRTATVLGDLSQVEAGPQSLLELLAQDFGIKLDRQESEARQRSWVRNIGQWISIKGQARAYEVLAKISGFEAEVSQLWHIGPGFLDTVPAANVIEIGEAGEGRSGADGSLTLGAGRIRLNSLTAVFTAADISRQIRIRDSDLGTNDKLYTIDRFLDANTVEFSLSDTATLPEANNGSLSWVVLRLYTDLPPLIPRFDEILVEELEERVAETFLPYDALTASFTVGELVTGGTSGATAALVSFTEDGPAGELRLADVRGTFLDNELLTGSVTGSADAELSGGQVKFFGVDRFCWEADFLAEVGVKVVLVEPLFPDPDIFAVEVEGPGNVVIDIGRWTFVDRTGQQFFVDTVPEGRLDYDAQTQVFLAGQTLYGPQELDYDSFAGPGFITSQTITGGTSGATAVIADDDNVGATGTLKLVQVDGIFIDGETLTSGANTADVDGDIRIIDQALITAVEESGLTGTLILADVRGTFDDDVLIWSILDTNGDGQPDTGTSIGAARADGNLRYRFTTKVAAAPKLSSPEGVYDLAYEGLVNSFTVGDTVTGGTSGATGVILEIVENPDDTGVLTIDTVTGGPGPFEEGETITDTGGGEATVSAVLTGSASETVGGAPGFWDSLLKYECEPENTCDYCPSYVAFANVTEGDIAAEVGVAIENAFQRVFRRFEEVTPAHVQLATRFTREIDISLNLQLELGEWVAASNIFYLFLTGLFDLGIPVDLVPLDVALKLAKIVPLPHPTADVSGSAFGELFADSTGLGPSGNEIVFEGSGDGTVS